MAMRECAACGAYSVPTIDHCQGCGRAFDGEGVLGRDDPRSFPELDPARLGAQRDELERHYETVSAPRHVAHIHRRACVVAAVVVVVAGVVLGRGTRYGVWGMVYAMEAVGSVALLGLTAWYGRWIEPVVRAQQREQVALASKMRAIDGRLGQIARYTGTGASDEGRVGPPPN
jgi:hypothetical protein